MNFWKNVVFLIALALLTFTALLSNIKKETCISKYEKIKNENNLLIKYYELKGNIEGDFIWNTGIISKSDYSKYLSKHVKSLKLIFLYDSVSCLSCYRYHMGIIRNMIGLDKVIIFNNKYEFIKNDFIGAHFYEINSNNLIYKQLVLLIDSDGRIIISDFPQFQVNHLSDIFYRIAKKYFRSEELNRLEEK